MGRDLDKVVNRTFVAAAQLVGDGVDVE